MNLTSFPHQNPNIPQNIPPNMPSNTQLIDAHAHLIWPELYVNIEEIVGDLVHSNIIRVVNCGVQNNDFLKCISLQKKYPALIVNTIGIHPEFALKEENKVEDFISMFIDYENCFSAIGEIGLDYFEIKKKSERIQTEQIFKELLSFAAEKRKPVIIHCRHAEKQAIKILEMEEYQSIPKILMHCFSGPELFLDKCLEHENWLFTIPTSICYKKLFQNYAKKIPIDRILLESDAPFLKPFPNMEMNHPKNIVYSANEIAKLKNLDLQTISEITTNNCKSFYNLVEKGKIT